MNATISNTTGCSRFVGDALIICSDAITALRIFEATSELAAMPAADLDEDEAEQLLPTLDGLTVRMPECDAHDLADALRHMVSRINLTLAN